jgi:hypothetical protein
MPQDWNYGTDHMGIASRALGRLREGLECYGLVTAVTGEASFTPWLFSSPYLLPTVLHFKPNV